MRHRRRNRFAAAAALAMTRKPWLAVAVAASALSTIPQAASAQNETALAKASQNPIGNLTVFPLQFNFNSGGALGSLTSLLLNVQPVMPLSLDKRWLLISRTIVPYTNVPIADGRRVTGIADIQQQLYFTLRKPHVFVFGFGPAFSIPSATNNVLRTGQWTLGPAAAMLVTPGRWVIGGLANNLWRIAGVNNGPDVNQFFVQPFINFNLPKGWAILTAPVITANWSASEDERWTVPVGIGLSKVSAVAKQSVSLGAQYYHNAMRPSSAGSDQFRFQFTLLYPNTSR